MRRMAYRPMPMPVLSDLLAFEVEVVAAVLGAGSPGCKAHGQYWSWAGRCACTHLSLQVADDELVQRFPRLVAVANVLESLGGVLAGDIQHDLLTAAARRNLLERGALAIAGRGINARVLVDKLGAVVDLVVDHDVNVLLGVVLGNILVGEFLGHCGGWLCWGFRSGQIDEVDGGGFRIRLGGDSTGRRGSDVAG